MKVLRTFFLMAVTLIAVNVVGSAQLSTIFSQLPSSITNTFSRTWLFLNLEQLTEKLIAEGYPDLPKEVILYGSGFGFEVAPQVRNINWYSSGSIETTEGEKTTRLSFGLGGLSFHYGFPSEPGIAVAVGIGLVTGSATLSLLQKKSASFEDAIKNPTNVALSRSVTMIEPQVSLVVSIMKKVNLILTGSYLVSLADGGWRQEAFQIGGPPDDFSSWKLTFTFEYANFLPQLQTEEEPEQPQTDEEESDSE